MTHKRLINVAILLDDHGADVRQGARPGMDGAVLATLKSAIKSRSSFIFVTGSTLQQYSKSKDLETNFDQAWEIYESKDPKASLFILIPEAYKNKVIAAWKKSKWIPPDKKITPAASTAALGLNIYDKKYFEKRTIEDIQTKTMPERSKSVPAITTALVKNKHGGFFNFYLSGHGGATTPTAKGSIASLSIADYQNLIQFLQKNCSVNLLVVLSCYGGGTHLFTSYPQATQLKFLKRDFLIVHYGTTDNPILLGRVNFLDFFQNIEEFEEEKRGIKFKGAQKPSVTLETILLSLYSPEFQKDPRFDFLLGNTPYALLPNSQIIVPINIFPEKINFLSYTKVMAHYFDNTNIVVDKDILFLSPSLIPATIKILKPHPDPAIVSAFPGSGIHFLKEIDITTIAIKPVQFIQTSFLKANLIIKSEAQKIFIIKKLRYKDGSKIKELNNIVLIIPGADTTPTQIVGGPKYYEDIIYQLAYEQSVNNKHLYAQAELHGKYSKKERAIILQGDFQPKPIQKSRYESAQESFDLIANAIKAHTLVGYLETDPQTIRQFPLLAGQKDYRSLIINMASLMDSKLLQEEKELNPWDFVWGKVGFLQPPPILPKEFGIPRPKEPIAKRREEQERFQELSDKIDYMLNKELFLRTIALFLAGQEVWGKLLLKVSIQQKQITPQQIDALLNVGLDLFPIRPRTYSKKELFERLINREFITEQQRATAKILFSVDQYPGKTLLEILINNKLITPQQAETAQRLFLTDKKYSGGKYSGETLLEILIDKKLIPLKQAATLLRAAGDWRHEPERRSFASTVKSLLMDNNLITIDQMMETITGYGAEELLKLIINNKLITEYDVEHTQTLFTTAMAWLKEGNTTPGGTLLKLLLDNQLLTPTQIITIFDTAMTQIKIGEISSGLSFLEHVTRSKHITQKQINMLFTIAMTWLSKDEESYGRTLLKGLINNRRITKNDTEKVETIRDSAVKLLKMNKILGKTLLKLLIDNQLVTPKQITTLFDAAFDAAMTQIKTGKISSGLDLIEDITKSKHITPKQIETLFTTAMTWLSKGEKYYGRTLLELLIDNELLSIEDEKKAKKALGV